MITYPLPPTDTFKLPRVDNRILDNLAQSVIHEPQALRSATILSASKSFTESWIKDTEISGLIYYKSLTCQGLLRSPSLLANRLFIIAGDFPDCTSESIQKIISSRIAGPLSFFAGSLSYCDQNKDHFNSLRTKLDLMIRIHKVTDSFLSENANYKNQGFSSINRICYRDHCTQKFEFKNDIIQDLKQRLTEAPEEFLKSAIKGIRATKRNI